MKTDLGRKSGGDRFRSRIMPGFFLFSVALILLSSGAYGEKQDTQLTISVIPDNPPAGISFNVSGILTDVRGTPLGNKRITLESSPDGDVSYPFERIAVEATDRSGRFTFYRGGQTVPGYIRASYSGNEEFNGSFSEIMPVHNVSVYSSGTHPVRKTGGLMITGDPDGSFVLLDNELRGTTPLALNRIESGSHILEIGKPGYQNQTMEIFIAPEKKTSFSFSLPPAGINLMNGGIESATGLHVYDNTSYGDDEFAPVGDPVYSFNRAGISVDIYGNETSSKKANKTQITTLYDEDPFGDGFSLSVIITDDDSPYR